MKEHPLIIFTLVTQLAVGIFVPISLLPAPGDWQGVSIAGPHNPLPALLAVTPLALLGMLASLLHLSTPLHAWRALSNLRTSWLSREIIFVSLFTGLSGLFTILECFNWGPTILRSALACSTTLTGLALIYNMARVYMLRSITPWRNWLTPASFYATTFLLGILALAAFGTGTNFEELMFGTGKQPWHHSALPHIAALLLLSVQFLATIQWVRTQARPVRHLAIKPAYQRFSSLPQPMQRWVALRLSLGAIGVTIFALTFPSCSSTFATLFLWLGFALALAGEIIGRALLVILNKVVPFLVGTRSIHPIPPHMGQIQRI